MPRRYYNQRDSKGRFKPRMTDPVAAYLRHKLQCLVDDNEYDEELFVIAKLLHELQKQGRTGRREQS